MLGFLHIAWSLFVHQDFLEAFKAAPRGIWDYFHRSYPRHPIEKGGYGQDLFESQHDLVKKALDKATTQLEQGPVNPTDLYQCVDKLMYWINTSILKKKLHYMKQLSDNMKLCEHIPTPHIAEYFHRQTTQVKQALVILRSN